MPTRNSRAGLLSGRPLRAVRHVKFVSQPRAATAIRSRSSFPCAAGGGDGGAAWAKATVRTSPMAHTPPRLDPLPRYLFIVTSSSEIGNVSLKETPSCMCLHVPSSLEPWGSGDTTSLEPWEGASRRVRSCGLCRCSTAARVMGCALLCARQRSDFRPPREVRAPPALRCLSRLLCALLPDHATPNAGGSHLEAGHLS